MKSILFITGELSGEIHTRNLIKALKKLRSDIKYYAVGSEILKSEGCEIVQDYKDISIIGFVEVLKRIFKVLKAFKKVREFIKLKKPDLIVLVDFPGFNLKIAKYCKKYNLKVIYFIAPQIWAWHYKRIKIIKKYVDFVIPILPFEEKIYRREKIPAKYYGNPIFENILNYKISKNFKEILKIPKNYKVVSIFPGSRIQEIEYNFDELLKALQILNSLEKKIYFLVSAAFTIDENILNEKLKFYKIDNIKVVKNENYNLLKISDVSILVSGTITLEALFFNVPYLVVYKLNPITYWFAKNFIVKIKFISLTNIVANKLVVKEFIGSDFKSEKIVKEVLKILEDKNYRKKMIKNLSEVKSKLYRKNALFNIAKKISEFI